MIPKEFSKEIDTILEQAIKKEIIQEMKNQKPKQPVIKLKENDLLKIVNKVIKEGAQPLREREFSPNERAITKALRHAYDISKDLGEQEIAKEISSIMAKIYHGKYQPADAFDPIVNEDKIPGLDAYKKANKESLAINKASTKETTSRIKAFNKAEGGDDPKFPHQHGGERKAKFNSKEEDEFVADFVGGGQEDLKYSLEPSEEFKERFQNGLTGDAKTGNKVKDTFNTMETDVNKNLAKKVKRKREKIDKAPMYKKDPQPVGDEKQKNSEPKGGTGLNEAVNAELKKISNLTKHSLNNR